MQTINFGGGPLNLFLLEKVLTILNQDGEVKIENVAKGTVSVFSLAAEFQEMSNAVDK